MLFVNETYIGTQQIARAEAAMCATQPQSAEVLAVLCNFKAAQEKRVCQYVRFNNAFTDYLRSKDEGPFRWASASGLYPSRLQQLQSQKI